MSKSEPDIRQQLDSTIIELMKYDWLKTPAMQYEADIEQYSQQLLALISQTVSSANEILDQISAALDTLERGA